MGAVDEHLAGRIAAIIDDNHQRSRYAIAEQIIADLGLQEETWSVLPAGSTSTTSRVWARPLHHRMDRGHRMSAHADPDRVATVDAGKPTYTPQCSRCGGTGHFNFVCPHRPRPGADDPVAYELAHAQRDVISAATRFARISREHTEAFDDLDRAHRALERAQTAAAQTHREKQS